MIKICEKALEKRKKQIVNKLNKIVSLMREFQIQYTIFVITNNR